MKKYKLPRSIRNASGMFLAKDLAGSALIIGIFILLGALLSDGESSWINRFIVFACFMTCVMFLAGYVYGRNNNEKIIVFLNHKRKFFLRELALIELHGPDMYVEKEIGIAKYKLKIFFTPLVDKFIFIDTKDEAAREEFKTAMDNFAKAISRSKDKLVKKVAQSLENELNSQVFNSIHDKTVISFDIESFIEELSFKEEKKVLFDRISQKQLLQKLELKELVNKIDNLILKYSENTI